MIKIPRSLDDLKKIVNDAKENVNVGDVFNKVKSTINTATDTVKSAAESVSAPKNLGESKAIFEHIFKNHQQQQDYIKQLQNYVSQLETKVETLEKALAAATPTEKVTETVAVVETKVADAPHTEKDTSETEPKQ